MAAQTDVVVIGGGLVGLSTAYYLVQNGVRNVTIVEERAKLYSLTSDASTGGFRTYYPADVRLTQLATRSIQLLEKIANESNNEIEFNQRGYLFLSADKNQFNQFLESAQAASRNGSGPVRVNSPEYKPSPEYGPAPDLFGYDVTNDPALIQRWFPFVTDKAVAAMHVRRAGYLNVARLGAYLESQLRKAGVTFHFGKFESVKTHSIDEKYRFELHVSSGSSSKPILSKAVVLAVGPFLKSVGKKFGVDFPVVNEAHAKALIKDPLHLFPQTGPFTIWADPVELPFTEVEKGRIRAQGPKFDWLLKPIQPSDHLRPLTDAEHPSGRAFYGIWTFGTHLVDEPVYPIPIDPLYGPIILRGLVPMLPQLQRYLQPDFNTDDLITIQAGYYCKTEENVPLIGRVSAVPGLFVCGALSGFGIMNSQAAGELVALMVSNHLHPDKKHNLPPYADAFSPDRFNDPAYLEQRRAVSARNGQL